MQSIGCDVQVLTELYFATPPRSPLLNVIRFSGSVPKHIQPHTIQRKLVNFMISRLAKLQEDTYFRVMRILQENPDLTQLELAEKLGIRVGGLNYCLKALMEKGLVKMRNFANSKNKFGYVYVLTPTRLTEKAAITRRFLQRKVDEYEALKAEIVALKAKVGDDEADGLRKGGQ